MSSTYFHDLRKLTNTRFWLNNPTIDEVGSALSEQVCGCTTNPAFCARLIKTEPDYINDLIDGLIRQTSDYDELAEAVYRCCTKRVMDLFMPVYERSKGIEGFVTLQCDPRYEHNVAYTVEGIKKNMELSPNYMAKIPVVEGGIDVIEECVRLNIPICATEVFAVSQALHIASRYTTACEKYGNAPVMYITHISGIFDEYLQKTAVREQIDIEPGLIKYAGLAVARKQYRELRARGYAFTMLGGGARGTHHFTGLVGEPHITINWSTAKEIMNSDIHVDVTIEEETPDIVLNELCKKLPDFQRAFDQYGLKPEEFSEFGPVRLFRNVFLKGWYELLAQIASRKIEHAL